MNASPAPAPQPEANAPPTAFGKGFITDAWYFAALSRDVKVAGLKRYELLGEPVLIGRTRAGQVYAMRDICPHRAAPLSAGKLVDHEGEGETVECPYHGWRFRTDGVCAAIPSLVKEQAFEADRIRVRSYPVVESQGLVFVWMASDPRNPSDHHTAAVCEPNTIDWRIHTLYPNHHHKFEGLLGLNWKSTSCPRKRFGLPQ